VITKADEGNSVITVSTQISRKTLDFVNDAIFQITILNLTITSPPPKKIKSINNSNMLIPQEIIWQFVNSNARKDNKIQHNGMNQNNLDAQS
jgi:hypothetical protein